MNFSLLSLLPSFSEADGQYLTAAVPNTGTHHPLALIRTEPSESDIPSSIDKHYSNFPYDGFSRTRFTMKVGTALLFLATLVAAAPVAQPVSSLILHVQRIVSNIYNAKQDAKDEAAVDADSHYSHTTYGWIQQRGENEEEPEGVDADAYYRHITQGWITKRDENEAEPEDVDADSYYRHITQGWITKRDEEAEPETVDADPVYLHTTFGWIEWRPDDADAESADAGDSDSQYTADEWITKRGENAE